MTTSTIQTTAEPGRPRIPSVPGAPLLELRDLEMHFSTRGEGLFGRANHKIRAVDGVSLQLREGETLGLVGESGLRQVDHRATASPRLASSRPADRSL